MSKENELPLEFLNDFLNAESFVFDNIEVKLTARKAVRKGRRKDSVLVEITPVDPDTTWKKWVNPDVLFKITTGK